MTFRGNGFCPADPRTGSSGNSRRSFAAILAPAPAGSADAPSSVRRKPPLGASGRDRSPSARTARRIRRLLWIPRFGFPRLISNSSCECVDCSAIARFGLRGPLVTRSPGDSDQGSRRRVNPRPHFSRGCSVSGPSTSGPCGARFRGAGRLKLLDDEAPAGRGLERRLDRLAVEPAQETPEALAVGRANAPPPDLAGLGVERVGGESAPVHVESNYDRHRDLLKLRLDTNAAMTTLDLRGSLLLAKDRSSDVRSMTQGRREANELRSSLRACCRRRRRRAVGTSDQTQASPSPTRPAGAGSICGVGESRATPVTLTPHLLRTAPDSALGSVYSAAASRPRRGESIPIRRARRRGKKEPYPGSKREAGPDHRERLGQRIRAGCAPVRRLLAASSHGFS
jgi:hypothetical protein